MKARNFNTSIAKIFFRSCPKDTTLEKGASAAPNTSCLMHKCKTFFLLGSQRHLENDS